MAWGNELIVERLKELGKTQKWLAEQCGTTEVSIGRYISGERTPDVNVAASLAAELGLDMNDLCGLPRRRMTLRDMVTTLLHGERIEIRGKSNYEIFTCGSDSMALFDYWDYPVINWFPHAAANKYCDFTVMIDVEG